MVMQFRRGPDKKKRARRKKILIGSTVGAALLGTGLFLKRNKQKPTETSVTVEPSPKTGIISDEKPPVLMLPPGRSSRHKVRFVAAHLRNYQPPSLNVIPLKPQSGEPSLTDLWNKTAATRLKSQDIKVTEVPKPKKVLPRAGERGVNSATFGKTKQQKKNIITQRRKRLSEKTNNRARLSLLKDFGIRG
jgi:hypothetical protein